ncbi:hypothetical protein ACFWXK_13695 [Streptomyces sp. NPDC059070]|uniref:hypothetical protein n=1 Tax=unclassified Streptomyces TaxID=2593676 RepID=UPI0034E2CC9E
MGQVFEGQPGRAAEPAQVVRELRQGRDGGVERALRASGPSRAHGAYRRFRETVVSWRASSPAVAVAMATRESAALALYPLRVSAVVITAMTMTMTTTRTDGTEADEREGKPEISMVATPAAK